MLREGLAAHMRIEGCQVIEAGSGEAALKVLQQQEAIDAVVTDVSLGGKVDGWEVGDAAAVLGVIRIIYVSANSRQPARQSSTFFDKPYNFDFVVRACRGIAD